MATPEQPDLFGGKTPQPAPAAPDAKRAPASVASSVQRTVPKSADAVPTPAPVSEELRDLGRVLPPRLHIGTSSWAFAGWAGLVYAESMSESRLSRDGLVAYAKHPLLRSVSVDRGYYGVLRADEYARYAEQVPPAFRFVVKAPAAVSDRFLRGEGGRPAGDNPRYLDAAWAAEQFVAPCIEGLGDRAGVLLFQFAPQLTSRPGRGVGYARSEATRFAGQLLQFLRALPPAPAVSQAGSPGWVYAVEVRDPELLTPDLAATLDRTRARYCHSVHARMPPLPEQSRRLAALSPGPFVARWNLHAGHRYEQAKAKYLPFDRIVDPDPASREAIARMAAEALSRGHPAYITVNNKAEGSAPLSCVELARAVREALRKRPPS